MSVRHHVTIFSHFLQPCQWWTCTKANVEGWTDLLGLLMMKVPHEWCGEIYFPVGRLMALSAGTKRSACAAVIEGTRLEAAMTRWARSFYPCDAFFFWQLVFTPVSATLGFDYTCSMIKLPGWARRTSADHLSANPCDGGWATLTLRPLILLYVNVWWGPIADRHRALLNERRLERSGLIFRPTICQDKEN